jgi:hypothetical protein
MDAFEYGGCCSYSPLTEGRLVMKEGLSPEQIDANGAERITRLTRGSQKWANTRQTKALTTRSHVCGLCNVSFGANNQLQNHYLTQEHINNAAGIHKDIKEPKKKLLHQQHKLMKKHYCAICDYSG